MKILIAEDDPAISNSLRKNFSDENIETHYAVDGLIALEMVENDNYDALILDWKMPNKSGFEVCKYLREKQNQIPILLLTAVTDIQRKVDVLNLGADDYITKPFSFSELFARLNAILRRKSFDNTKIIFGKMILNLVDRKLFIDNIDIKLTEKEFELLKYFIENKGAILSKEKLCKDVWGYDFIPESNLIESAVKNLRKKLEASCEKKLIKNVYGEGYILIEE